MRAKGIKRIFSHQTGFKMGRKRPAGGRLQGGKFNAVILGDIDDQFTLTAGIMNGSQLAGGWFARGVKQRQRRRHFIHISNPVHAIGAKHRLIDRVIAGDCPCMRHRHLCTLRCPAYFQYHHRDGALARRVKCLQKSCRITNCFNKKADNPGLWLMQRPVHIIGNCGDKFHAGGNRKREPQPPVVIWQRAEGRSRLRNPRNPALLQS